MSATEREHVMPPRPLMPWTMALCAGMCMSCALVLNVAADTLLWERAAAVGPLWAIPVAAAVFVLEQLDLGGGRGLEVGLDRLAGVQLSGVDEDGVPRPDHIPARMPEFRKFPPRN